MRFLSDTECVEWCSQRGFPAERIGDGRIHAACEQPAGFELVPFIPPVDSGHKVAFARFLYSLLPSTEALVWLSEWSVFPSSQHLPVFRRVREALGEHRELIEAAGHLFDPSEQDDGISIIAMALLFIWNCHVIAGSGHDFVFFSHDEHGHFGSRDPAVADSVRARLEGWAR